MLAALQHRADQAAHIFLVGIFFGFPISLAATNILMALMLASWLLAGQYKARWNSLKSNPITWPALMLYGLVIVGTTYSTASGAEMLQHLNKYSKFLFVLMAITLLQEPIWRQRCWTAFGYAMLFTLGSVYANIWFDLPWSVSHIPTHSVCGDRSQSIPVRVARWLCGLHDDFIRCTIGHVDAVY